MAETFKPFGANDTTTTRTLLHEAIPVTGTIISGTYTKANSLALNAELNIKLDDYAKEIVRLTLKIESIEDNE